MAVNYAELAEQLSRFYDFTDKVVLCVGAAGRQLLAPKVRTRKLIAIDRDAEALRRLERPPATKGARPLHEIVASAFEEVTVSGDVVYFEFCLHEMADPYGALLHARQLALEVVVFDHLPGSEWVHYANEEEGVSRAAEALERLGTRRRQMFETEQRFSYYAELLAKLAPQGPAALERATRFAGASDIVIPMKYQLALL